MEVPGVGNTYKTTEPTNTTAPDATPTLDYNAFLHLLIAQMKNQDPMEPMKSSDYVAQLATFSQVEKSVQMNERLNSLLTSSNLALAESLVGRAVIFPDGGPSGVVVAAKSMTNGVMVLLDTGEEMMVGPGVIVGEAPSETPTT